MKNVVRSWCGVAMLAAIGCGGSDDKTGDDAMKRAQVSGPNAMAGSTAAGSGGAGSSSTAMAGKSGGVAGMTMSGGSGGKPATTPMGGGGAGGTMMMPDKPAQVLADPADIASCDPAGSPPSADEVVEVLEVKTGDVVPGGFAAPGGTYYGCFWVGDRHAREAPHHRLGRRRRR